MRRCFYGQKNGKTREWKDLAHTGGDGDGSSSAVVPGIRFDSKGNSESPADGVRLYRQLPDRGSLRHGSGKGRRAVLAAASGCGDPCNGIDNPGSSRFIGRSAGRRFVRSCRSPGPADPIVGCRESEEKKKADKGEKTLVCNRSVSGLHIMETNHKILCIELFLTLLGGIKRRIQRVRKLPSYNV